ncbi:MBOAT family protein [Polynucleobacter sp. AP-Jannik-300A-C4]|uniref:MBOAT family O-acyltransferase n=1 Tax=Polynucleobacter sp. AP-Jannik-300A-C4 TaxID=2576928 RepID=UPI001BFD0750|nr:MBOAT family O-acyltransferase [Polynucleobacter sp. AP-Jannik-300A-C4]QWE22954.1 MBOAT family protein [Polynucleobacter sp. AP-Jannik-300A-C4]
MLFADYSFWFFLVATLFLVNCMPLISIDQSKNTRILCKIFDEKCTLSRVFMITSCISFLFIYSNNSSVYPIFALGGLTYIAPFIAERFKCRAFILVPIFACILTLVYYKYTTLIIEMLSKITHGNLGEIIASTKIEIGIAPLAISFFTFEFCHYLIDVYRGKPRIQKVDEFLAFALFFPTLVAGPIKRYNDFLDELRRSSLKLELEHTVSSFLRIIIGLSKKLFIADPITKLINDMYADGAMPSLHGLTTVGFILLLYVRIYIDFSAYSDIAIGCARLFGIRIPENFNFPFIATSISDFWRRWHISLSSWIRDYLYIPLGGNRKTIIRGIINVCVVMFVAGLWHGAAWNFALWGIYHGIGLAIQNTYAKLVPTKSIFSITHSPLVGFVLTFCFVSIGWVLFFYPPLNALKIISTLTN